MQITKVFAVAAAAFVPTAVAADTPSAINDVVLKIKAQTTTLDNDIVKFTGQFAQTLPILADAITLLGTINNGTTVAKASAPLTTRQTLSIATNTVSLANVVNKTIEDVIAKKAKFDALLLGIVILGDLKADNDSASQFATATIAKVPDSFKGPAALIFQPILDSFAKGIAAYSKLG